MASLQEALREHFPGVTERIETEGQIAKRRARYYAERRRVEHHTAVRYGEYRDNLYPQSGFVAEEDVFEVLRFFQRRG